MLILLKILILNNDPIHRHRNYRQIYNVNKMKKSQLKQLIKEEIRKVLSETELLTNRLLDKILKSGINSLTDFEKDLLDRISNEEDLRYMKFKYIKDLYRKMGYDEADIGDIFQNNIFHWGNPSTMTYSGGMGEFTDIEEFEDHLEDDIFNIDEDELKDILRELNPSGEDLKKGGWI
jgi:hypothetical protein